MYNIVIVGAGQLGSRHLQSMLKSDKALSIHVIDPLDESLEISKQRAEEIELGNIDTVVNYSTNIKSIPESVHTAIVATSSLVRLSVIRSIFENATVKYMVIEKVLFQSLKDYDEAEEILAKHGTQVWVNCPRRMYPTYEELRNLFTDNERLAVSYEGGDWGLACNAIHFIDVISYLNNNYDYVVETDKLTGVNDSKRKGYKEIFGTLMINQNNGTTISLTSLPGMERPSVFKILSENKTIIISENLGNYLISEEKNNWKWEERVFKLDYQSNLSHKVFHDIIETGDCSLTPFDKSQKIHIPLITALTYYFNKNGVSGCPIT